MPQHAPLRVLRRFSRLLSRSFQELRRVFARSVLQRVWKGSDMVLRRVLRRGSGSTPFREYDPLRMHPGWAASLDPLSQDKCSHAPVSQTIAALPFWPAKKALSPLAAQELCKGGVITFRSGDLFVAVAQVLSALSSETAKDPENGSARDGKLQVWVRLVLDMTISWHEYLEVVWALF